MTNSSNTTTSDPHAVLGLKPSATNEEIRNAYRKHAKENHPDLNPGDEAAEQRFKEISEAYAALSDPSGRKRDLAKSSRLVDIDRPVPVDDPSPGNFHTMAFALAGILALGTTYLFFSFWLYDNHQTTTAKNTIRLSYEANVSSSGQPVPPQEPVKHSDKPAPPQEPVTKEPVAKEPATKQPEPKQAALEEEELQADNQIAEAPDQTEEPVLEDSQTQIAAIEPIPLPQRNPFRSGQDDFNDRPQLTARLDVPEPYEQDIPERHQTEQYQDDLPPPSSFEPTMEPAPQTRPQYQTQPRQRRAGYRRWILSRGQLCWIKWNGGLKCGEQLTNLSTSRRKFIIAKIREAQPEQARLRHAPPPIGRPDHWQGHKPDQLNDETWLNESRLNESRRNCWINRHGYKVCRSPY